MQNSSHSFDDLRASREGLSNQTFINVLKRYVRNGARLIELGSGSGNDFEILSKDFNSTASDISAEVVDGLSRRFPENLILNLDAVNFETKDGYDCVYSANLLHHLSDSELIQSFLCQENALLESGIVAHLVWNSDKLTNSESHRSRDDWQQFAEEVGTVLSFELYENLIKDDLIGFVVRV